MSEWIKRLAARYSEVNINESKFLIPEEIPTAERTAFMGAAAAAHKAGQTHFNFGGKKHKVTMKTDTARAIADDVKESVEQIDEISMGKMQKYAKAAKKDIEQKRNKVKAALDQPASVKHAKAGLDAMKGLTKRSRGSDMYVDKMTGRSKVKPTAEEDEVVMNPKKEKRDKGPGAEMAQEGYNDNLRAMNPKSNYSGTRYGNDKSDPFVRANAHFEAARGHEVKAKKYKKARDLKAADLHTAAAKAHDKASNGISRAIRLAPKVRDMKVDGEILKNSRDAHAASMKAAAHRRVRKEQNESTIPSVYARILESRDAHYKKASKPEDWNEKEKNNKGAMDMKADHKGETIDNPEASGDEVKKAANAAPKAAMRRGDNAAGDKKVIPSATPMKGM